MGYSTTLKDVQGIPISQVWVPTVGWASLQGVNNTTGVDGNVSAAVATALMGPTGLLSSISPLGGQHVAQEPNAILYDTFDGGVIDTVNIWKAPTSSGGGVGAAVTAGVMTLGSGTTAAGYSTLETINTYRPWLPGYIVYSASIKIEFPITTNAYRFWGVGTNPGSPTTALPLTDAVGFEIGLTGAMAAVVFANGVRTQVQDLSASGNNFQPLNAGTHSYIIYLRADKFYFCIDGQDKQVGVTGPGVTPAVQSLPLKILSIASSGTPPVSSAVVSCPGIAISDTAKNATQIADGTYPWRRVFVDTYGGLRSAGCNVTSVAAGAAGPTVIKATPGTIYGIQLTTGTVAGIPTAFDNASAASGKVVASLPTNAAAFTMLTLPGQGANCALGITMLGGATMPAMNVYWN